MAMNIKNEEAQRLVKQLAQLTGESQTEAIIIAVRERLERVRRQQDHTLADDLMKIAEDCSKLWKEPWKSMPHGELLYDERGLPK